MVAPAQSNDRIGKKLRGISTGRLSNGTDEFATITPQHRAASFIRKGQRAWTAIKATAEEQRTLWLEVGVALMYGKMKENRKEGQKFSEWADETFSGLDKDSRADALWFASDFSDHPNFPPGLTHPTSIRKWANEQAATRALPEDLQALSLEESLTLPPRDAERVAKTLLRASSGDEGADIAKRHAV